MWPIKTKREMYDAYMLEIEQIEIENKQLDHEINRNERKKARNVERINELKETAKLFE